MKLSPNVKVLTLVISIVTTLTGWTSIAISRTMYKPALQPVATEQTRLTSAAHPKFVAVTRSSR